MTGTQGMGVGNVCVLQTRGLECERKMHMASHVKRCLVMIAVVWAVFGASGSTAYALNVDSLLTQLEQMAVDSGWTFEVGNTGILNYTLAEVTGVTSDTAGTPASEDAPEVPDTLTLPSYYGVSGQRQGQCGDLPPDGPGVHDQGQAGTCWAFATMGTAEWSAWKKFANDSLDLSEQWLVDYNTHGWDPANGGDVAFNYMLADGWEDKCHKTGALSETQWPYCACWMDSTDCTLDRMYWLQKVGHVANTVTAIKSAIATFGAVSCRVAVDRSFMAYRYGVYNRMTPDSICGMHQVVLVGWDDSLGSNGAWVLRNSWGDGWGCDGYMYIAYGACGVGEDPHFVVVTEDFDYDNDSVGNADDNCIVIDNTDQADIDDDEVGDLCDDCPYVADPLQGDDSIWGGWRGFTSSWVARTHTVWGQGTHFDYPENESPDAWTLVDGCSTCDRSGADSTLTIPTGGRIYYSQTGSDFDFPNDSLIIEFRVKSGAVSIPNSYRTHTNVRFGNGEYGNQLSIKGDSIWLYGDASERDTVVYAGHTANDYHSFRIVVIGTDIDVYADFAHVLDGELVDKSAVIPDGIFWGDLISNAHGASYWRYFRHNGWVDGSPKMIENEEPSPVAEKLPAQYGLSQNYPNPFNPVTQISFALANPGQVTLEVFNTLGQKVTTLADRWYDAGSHSVEWNAESFASGVYLYKLSAGDYVQTRKMILLK